MSYSRWSNSNWYSFWCSSSDDLPKEDQVLALWHATHRDFTYKELSNIGATKLKTLYPEANESDINEALDIILTFITDVNNEFTDDDCK